MRIPDKIAVSIPKSYAGIMFYITWFMYSFVYSILSSEYSTLVNLSKLNRITQYFIILGLGSCYFLSNEIIKKKNVRLLVFLATIFLISIKNINLNFLAMIMFIVVAQNIDLEKFLKTDLAFRIFMFIFIVLSCAVGIIDNYKAEINGNLKMSFGFGHPNVYCFYLFTILLEYMYVNFYKLRCSNMAFIMLIFGFAYITGAARTSCISFVMAFLLYIAAKKKRRLICNRFSAFMVICAFAAIAALSFASVRLYMKNPVKMEKYNEILTGRLYLASEFLRKYDINLFGNDVVTVGARAAKQQHTMAMILDNAYIRCVLFYGVVFSALIFILYSKKIIYYAKKIDPRWICFASFFFISGFAESYLINIFYNVTLLFLLKKDEYSAADTIKMKTNIEISAGDRIWQKIQA